MYIANYKYTLIFLLSPSIRIYIIPLHQPLDRIHGHIVFESILNVPTMYIKKRNYVIIL